MKKQIFLILLFLSLGGLYAQNEIDYNDSKIYLVTFGPGDDVYLRWGHFGVIVSTPGNKDILYDYGNFSFTQDNFFGNFIKGVLYYSKEKTLADPYLRYYMLTNRSILIQELNLTPDQKEQYINKLEDDVKPKNKYYLYDHYYNNCVSEIINYLDELTNGQFYKDAQLLSGRSFRDYSMDYVSSNYPLNILITILLGGKVDREITIQESLFLPENAANWAKDLVITKPDGKEEPFVINNIVLYSSKDRDKVIYNSKTKISKSLILGLIIGLISFIVSLAPKIDSIIKIIIGLLLTIFGSVLFFMTFFTGHYYIHNNINLLFIGPQYILLIISGFTYFRDNLKQASNFINIIFFRFETIVSFVILIMFYLGLVKQNNIEIILLFLPTFLVNLFRQDNLINSKVRNIFRG